MSAVMTSANNSIKKKVFLVGLFHSGWADNRDGWILLRAKPRPTLLMLTCLVLKNRLDGSVIRFEKGRDGE